PASLPGGAIQTYDLDGIGGPSANRADVLLGSAQDRTDVDFGYRGTASLGDRIWQDLNANGIQDAGEVGLPGVTVALAEAGQDNVLGTADDLIYATTTTDANGLYLFDNLLAGDYRVTVVVGSLPTGAIQSYDLNGGLDNSADRTLVAAGAATDVDFGYYGSGSIGDFVWNDRDGDGNQDANEPGIPGVTVQLTMAGLDGVLGTADDLTYLTQTTDSNGNYSFGNLLKGLYRVDVIDSTVTLNDAGDPTGLVLTTGNDPLDVNLANGQDYTTADFGYQGPGSIGDTVWFDQNGNGVQDAGEPGIANVDLTVVWYGMDGVLGTADDVTYLARTDANGKYSLTGLPLGDYAVSLDFADLPTGLDVQTYDLSGALDNAATVTLTVADPNEDRADFGYRGTGSLGDYVWQDLDADGVQDAFEPAVPGVTVELRGHGVDGIPGTADDLLITTTTDAAGLYSFDNLPPGVYTVTVIAATLPGGAIPTFDLDGTGTANTATLTLANGENRTDADFGYRGVSSIGDFVWNDRDGDGNQDANEPGIPGVTLQLTAAGLDGVLGTADDLVYA
ncbi:MAG TPA: SdrD B-like domain-containing protein, partial [Myxococcota bacterium]